MYLRSGERENAREDVFIATDVERGVSAYQAVCIRCKGEVDGRQLADNCKVAHQTGDPCESSLFQEQGT